MPAVGDKQILGTQTFLLEDDEVGQFELNVGGIALPVRVRFRSPDAPESAGRWELDDGVLKMEFMGWGEPGSSFGKAQRIGDFRGVPLGFNLAHQRLGSLNCATIQLYLGGTYE